MEKLKGFYYVTAATGEQHIKNVAQYALKSLLKAGISLNDIHCIVNTDKDVIALNKFVPKLTNVCVVNEPLDHIRWKAHKGKRKFSVFKAAGLHKCFTKPLPSRCMVYFDTDVLFFKNPEPFFKTKWQKTWFHHGKILEDVSHRRNPKGIRLTKKEINPENYKSLSQWVSAPAAWCMVKHNCTNLPDREAVAGFYILHPSDHEKLLRLTYENCLEIVKSFKNHVDVGDQKPMNAALNILQIDWHGGNRLECQEHLEYFDHYFGTKARKQDFLDAIKKLKL